MLYLIAVFKNRSDSIAFLSIMKSYIKDVKIINTPKELNMPCGISVALPLTNAQTVLNMLNRRHFTSFAGIYKMQYSPYGTRIVPFSA